MASCEYCGDATGELAFECDYCGESFCQTHRLPEAHDCTHVSRARPPTSADDEPEAFGDQTRGARTADEIDLAELRKRAETEDKPYSVVEVEHTVGSPTEPDLDSSPDVAIDGSIADNGDSDDSTTGREEEKTGLSTRTAILIFVLLSLIVLLGVYFLNFI